MKSWNAKAEKVRIAFKIRKHGIPNDNQTCLARKAYELLDSAALADHELADYYDYSSTKDKVKENF